MKTFYACSLFLSSMLITNVSANSTHTIEFENTDTQSENESLDLESFEFEELDLDALLNNISQEDIRSVQLNQPPPHWYELWAQRLKLASSFLRVKGSEAKDKALQHVQDNRQIYLTGAISTASVIVLLLASHYGLKYCSAG